jgi:hypothetical protein
MFDSIWNEMLDNISIYSIDSSHHLLNPYPFFKPVDRSETAQFVWPRGFPLEFIKDVDTFEFNNRSRVPAEDANIAVYQSLADLDPDVDAIFRMTRQLPVFFSETQQILVSPVGSFAPWNAQATIFAPAAFMGLFLPVSVTGRVSDIWRSYISSRMMWACGYQVAFTSPFVNQFRNPHNYHVDFKDELDLFNVSNQFILELMSSQKYNSITDMYLGFISILVQNGFLQKIDLELASLWIQDLQSAGYAWPEILSADLIKLQSPRVVQVIDHRIHLLSDKSILTNKAMKESRQSKDRQTTAIIDNSVEAGILLAGNGQNKEIKKIKDTAVCIAGQLRSLNMNSASKEFPQNLEPLTTPFSAQDLHGRTVVSRFNHHVFFKILTL